MLSAISSYKKHFYLFCIKIYEVQMMGVGDEHLIE